MKKRLKILPLFFVAVLILVIGQVSAATISTLTPANNECLSGTRIISSTLSGFELGAGVQNITFSYSTDGTTWTRIGSNTTANLTGYTFSWDTSGVTNAANYRLNATIQNITSPNITQDDEQVNTGITIDDDLPTVALELDKAITERLTGAGISYNCIRSSDPLSGVVNYSVSLFNPDSTQAGSTKTTSQGTFENGDFSELGEYKLQCKIRDVCNNAVASNLTIQVKSSLDDVETLIFETINPPEEVIPAINMTTIGGGLAIMIIGVLGSVGLVYYRESKKKNRRK